MLPRMLFKKSERTRPSEHPPVRGKSHILQRIGSTAFSLVVRSLAPSCGFDFILQAIREAFVTSLEIEPRSTRMVVFGQVYKTCGLCPPFIL